MDFTLLGIAFGKTQTFRKGAEAGPDYLRQAFPKLETFVNGIESRIKINNKGMKIVRVKHDLGFIYH